MSNKLRKIKKTIGLACLICAFGIFGGCINFQPNSSSESSSSVEDASVSSESSDAVTSSDEATSSDSPQIDVALNVEVLSLDVYDEGRIEVVSGASEEMEWVSNNPNVATVNQEGVVTALSAGNCEITVTTAYGSATCHVMVTNSYVSPILVLESGEVEIAKTGEYVLSPTLLYKGEDCTEKATISYHLSTNSAANVVNFQQEGNQGVFTGENFGTVEYVVYAEYAGVQVSQIIKITVKEVGVVFDSNNLHPVKGGFEAKLDTLMEGNFVPQISAVVDGEIVENVSATYVSQDESIVKIAADGSFEIVKDGSAEVIGTYNGNIFKVWVTVEKPTRNTSLAEDIPVEVGSLRDLAFEGGLLGELVSATIDGVSVGVGIVDGQLQLSKEGLEGLPISSYGKDIALTIETSKLIYKASIDLYTLVINSETEYKMIGTLSKAACKDNDMLFGGYFILGNNIQVKGGVAEFIDRDGNAKGIKGDGTEGFCGVFDGNGYIIDGISRTSTAGNAFITVMHKNGVIKNLGFTNVTYSATAGSFLVQMGSGTVQDVYIQYSAITEASDWAGTVMNPNITMNRVFIDAADLQVSGTGSKFSLFAVTKANVKVEADSYIAVLPTDYELEDIKIDGTADIEQSYMGKRTFRGWDTLKVSDTFAAIKGWDATLWHTDEETGKVVFGDPTTDNTPVIPDDMEQQTITVTEQKKLDLDFNNDGSLNMDVVLDLGLETLLGGDDYTVLKVNDEVVNGKNITAMSFGFNYGEQDVVILAKRGNVLYTVNMPVLLVSKVINTVEDYNNWGNISKALGYGGYFELGADLSQAGGIELNNWNTNSYWVSSEDVYKGFAGTFDGCGHVINGLKMSTNLGLHGGFVGTMTRTGVLKNIGLINVDASAITDTSNVIGTTTFGTLENIYVQYKAVPTVPSKLRTITLTANTGAGLSVDVSASKVLVDASQITDTEDVRCQLLPDYNADNAFYFVSPAGNAGWYCSWAHDAEGELHYNHAFASFEALKANETAWGFVSTWDDTNAAWHIDETTGVIYFGSISPDVTQSYVVTFDSDGGTAVSSVIVEEGGLVPVVEAPTKEADVLYTYTFAGWYNGDTLWNFETDVVTKNITLTAKWDTTTNESDDTIIVEMATKLNLDMNVEGVSQAGNLDLGISALLAEKGVSEYTLLTVDGVEVTNNEIPASIFGKQYGAKDIVVTAKAGAVTYTIYMPVLLVSKVITTVDEFKTFTDIAVALGTSYEGKPSTYGGYFELGNDINVGGEEITMKVFNTISATDGSVGFAGTFDGCGHIIDNLVSNDGQGLLGLMTAEGTLKNVGFTNATLTSGNYIGKTEKGTIENIFVQYKAYTSGRTFSDAVGDYTTDNLTFNGIFVDGRKLSNTGTTEIATNKSEWSQHVYCLVPASVNNLGYIYGWGDFASAAKDYGFYSVEALFANETAMAKLAAWDTSVWSFDEATQTVKFGDYVVAQPLATYTVTFNSNGGTTVESISVKEGQKIPAVENPTKADDGTYLYVFAGWYNGDTLWNFDTDVVTESITLTAKWEEKELATNEAINVESTTEINLNMDTTGASQAGNLDLGISALLAEKGVSEYTLLTVDGVEVTNNEIPASIFGQQYGAKDIVVMAKAGTTTYTINMPVLLVSKVITSAEELGTWRAIATALGDNGYFKLGNDITGPVSYAGDSTVAFNGTFDGCGYVVDGLTVTSDNGLMGAMGQTGVLKNIGFTNAVLDGVNFLTKTSYGTLENIYIQYVTFKDGSRGFSNVGGDSGVANMTVSNMLIDASALTNARDKIGDMEANINGYATEIYCIMPESTAGNAGWIFGWSGQGANNGFASYEAMFANATAAADLATWTSPWTVSDGTMKFGTHFIVQSTPKYTVTFNSNGGSAVASATVEEGGKLEKPVDPTKEADTEYSYTFAGWYNGETEWDFENDTVNSVLTLTAKWTAIELATNEAINVESTTEINLNMDTTGASQAGNLDLGLAAIMANEGVSEYTLLTVDGVEVTNNEIPASIFGQQYGAKDIVVMAKAGTTTYTINMPVLLVSKVITSAEELGTWRAIATALGDNGYFKLGNDITGPISYAGDSTVAFNGTFDGCGYIVDGLTVTGDNGLMGAMGETGVLKNIGFTNAVLDGTNFLTKTSYGTLENIYIQYVTFKDGSRGFSNVGGDSGVANMTVTNMFIDASALTNARDKIGDLEANINGYATEIYCIMPESTAGNAGWIFGWSGQGANNGFASYEAMFANATAAADLATWDTSVWTVDATNKTVTFGIKE